MGHVGALNCTAKRVRSGTDEWLLLVQDVNQYLDPFLFSWLHWGISEPMGSWNVDVIFVGGNFQCLISACVDSRWLGGNCDPRADVQLVDCFYRQNERSGAAMFFSVSQVKPHV